MGKGKRLNTFDWPGIMARSANVHAAELRAASDGAVRDGQNFGCVADDTPNATTADIPMTIGQVAREFGMTLRALRFYEAKRLIAPQRQGAIRLYHRSDRERIALILTGRKLGFTLTEISDLVGRAGSKGLHLTREKCVEQITLLERQKRGLDVAIAELRQIYTSFYKTYLRDADLRSH